MKRFLKVRTYSKSQWLFYSALSVAVVLLCYCGLYYAIVYWLEVEPKASLLVLSPLVTLTLPTVVSGCRFMYYAMLRQDIWAQLKCRAVRKRFLVSKSVGLIVALTICNFYGVALLLDGDQVAVPVGLMAVSWAISYLLHRLMLYKVIKDGLLEPWYGVRLGPADSNED